MKITKKEAKELGELYNINFEVIKFEEWYEGLLIEMEHIKLIKECVKKSIDIKRKVSEIAIAHLEEDPMYYKYLSKLEEKRKYYWKNREKPSIYKSA